MTVGSDLALGWFSTNMGFLETPIFAETKICLHIRSTIRVGQRICSPYPLITVQTRPTLILLPSADSRQAFPMVQRFPVQVSTIFRQADR